MMLILSDYQRDWTHKADRTAGQKEVTTLICDGLA
jgi:hypothetical protein